MKATSSGVAFSAAKIRSPSFSRSSSSMTTTALPAAMSATALSTESNLVIDVTLLFDRPTSPQYEPPRDGNYCDGLSAGIGKEEARGLVASLSGDGRAPPDARISQLVRPNLLTNG